MVMIPTSPKGPTVYVVGERSDDGALRSLIEIALPVVEAKTSMPSCWMVCAAGSVFSGASLTPASSRLFSSIVIVAVS